MAARSNCCFGNGVLEKSARAEPFLSTANVNLLEQFVEFCKSKKLNEHKEVAQEINVNRNDEVKAHGESTGFKEELNMYFGELLPVDVIDELCKLVQENSYGKCSLYDAY